MKRIILIASAMFTLASCKNYLDIKPNGQTIPKTADEFSSLLNNTLAKIDDGEGDIVGDASSVMDEECFADNLEASLTKSPEGDYLVSYVGERVDLLDYGYEMLYAVIRDCNIVIGELKERDTRLGKDVLGTAYALRGVCYYQLLRKFCEPCRPDNSEVPGVPLVTEFDMEARPLRSSYEQTVERAAEDLKKAIEYDIQDKVYRFNSDVAAGYLARLYFWSQHYDEAIVYAEKVLKKYPLLSGEAYKEMMGSQIQRKGNTIFKAQIIISSAQNTWLESAKKSLLYRPLSSKFIDLFPEKERDIRYKITIGLQRTSIKNILASLRSAEMCMILAESHYHEGDSGEALRYLNLLRSHRIEGTSEFTTGTLPSVNPNDLIKVDAKGNSLTPLLYAILCERRKEFYMENGDRWFELKRNGRPEFWVSKKGLKYTTLQFMYTYPLPIKEALITPGMIQNPGYENVK